VEEYRCDSATECCSDIDSEALGLPEVVIPLIQGVTVPLNCRVFINLRSFIIDFFLIPVLLSYLSAYHTHQCDPVNHVNYDIDHRGRISRTSVVMTQGNL
jgi:hypothetical protein